MKPAMVILNRTLTGNTAGHELSGVASIQANFTHKLTTRFYRESQAVAIKDLNIKSMLANDKFTRAMSKVGFGMFRAQIKYKAKC
ncbi:MAG: transposase, partial [Pseudomonadota bacterium]|nr:transposase [Pseudomonadota bacterium]